VWRGRSMRPWAAQDALGREVNAEEVVHAGSSARLAAGAAACAVSGAELRAPPEPRDWFFNPSAPNFARIRSCVSARNARVSLSGRLPSVQRFRGCLRRPTPLHTGRRRGWSCRHL